MKLIWIITAILFALFAVLFLARVIQKKRKIDDAVASAEDKLFNFNEFLKMAYPAVVIYAIVYSIFLLLCRFEVFGSVEKDMNTATWIPGLLLLYIAIWLLLHIIDMDCRSRDLPFATFLKTINTNVGIHSWNFILLAVSIVVLILSLILLIKTHAFYICGPLYMAVIISVFINIFVGDDSDWHVKSPAAAKWRPNDSGTPEKVKIKAASQDGREESDEGSSKIPNNPNNKTPVEREFKWNLNNKWGITPDQDDVVKVTLYKEDWEDPDQDMRKKNPFYGKNANGEMNWHSAASNLSQSASLVIQGPDSAGENSEGIALETIINSAIDVASKYNLAEQDVPELLLTLCQTEIPYIEDQKSTPISQFNGKGEDGNPILEYFRFAAETLYDKQGDCDCKSILTCRLMKALGMDAKLVTVCDKGKTVPTHAAIIFKDEYNRYQKCNNAQYAQYTFCESTDDGWRIGVVPEGIDESSINVIA